MLLRDIELGVHLFLNGLHDIVNNFCNTQLNTVVSPHPNDRSSNPPDRFIVLSYPSVCTKAAMWGSFRSAQAVAHRGAKKIYNPPIK